jgi:hypothetical protein
VSSSGYFTEIILTMRFPASWSISELFGSNATSSPIAENEASELQN